MRKLVLLALLGCSSPPSVVPAAVDDAGTVDLPDASLPAPDATPEAPACDALSARSVPLVVGALPDVGEKPFLDALSAATKSIRVMVYEMGYGGILDTLKAKATAGVKVQVILDVAQISSNQKYMDMLAAAGAEVHWSDPQFPYMHAKTLVVDDAVAVISTGNYGKTFMMKERNFVATDRDPQDLRVLASLFDADFNKLPPDLSCTRLVVSPVNSRPRIVDLIQSATTDILVESMEMSDYAVRKALAERAAAGVHVRAILAAPSWIKPNADAAAFLKTSGVESRYMSTLGVHVKAIVVDGKRAYLGSENFSPTSLSKNREVGLITDEPTSVSVMQTTFETDWPGATAF